MRPLHAIVLGLAAASMIGVSGSAAETAGDQSFVAKVSQGGMFEVQAGKLAADKGSTQDVRDFGVMEAHDHSLVGDKLKANVGVEKLSFSSQLNPEFSGKLKHLQSLSGPAFDQAYLSDMATLHAADGAAFAKVAQTGETAGMRAFGAETHRIVQRHIGAIQAVPPTR